MQQGYSTIAAEAGGEFEERRSRFIGQIAPVQDEAAAIAFVERIRARHREATHNVYAYLVRQNNITRFSDDGEPSGTAGRPVLEVLQREGLTDVAVVVTRYFGGILLGAGGLVRAYAEGVALAVRTAQRVEMRPAAALLLLLDYPLYGKVNYLLPNYNAREVSAAFGAEVSLSLVLPQEAVAPFQKAVVELSAGRVTPVVVRELSFPF